MFADSQNYYPLQENQLSYQEEIQTNTYPQASFHSGAHFQGRESFQGTPGYKGGFARAGRGGFFQSQGIPRERSAGFAQNRIFTENKPFSNENLRGQYPKQTPQDSLGFQEIRFFFVWLIIYAF